MRRSGRQAVLKPRRRPNHPAPLAWRSGLLRVANSIKWTISVAALYAAAACGTIPNSFAILHSRLLYRESPKFVGEHGPLSRAQGIEVVAALQQRADQPDLLKRQLEFQQAIGAGPLVLGNKVTLLENGPDTYNAMFSALKSAKDSINIETYIISDDRIGREFADQLIEKQQQGVQVNLIYDSFGSMAVNQSFFDRLQSSGIRVLQFNPVNPLVGRLRWAPSHRDHRKLMVIDGRIVFTGGINISGVYSSGWRRRKRVPYGTLDYWRDTDVEIEGPVAAEFQKVFFSTWESQKGGPLSPRDYFPELKNAGDEIVQVQGSVPEQFSLIYFTLISAINNAVTNVYISDAYFAPDQQFVEALSAAARRGVDVRLLVPAKTDVPFILAAARSHYLELLDAGVKIYEWRGKMMHAKTATVDHVWSTVGSSNLDWWSIVYNNELNAVVLGSHFGAQMDLMFRNDMEGSDQIKLSDWQKRSLVERVDESIARMLQPVL
ncbi:MAG: cardiolipin synthase [Candidatus Binataceae bacterium]|nr:cardiolipin synthase [Candidatus Binataceae bacterium]